MKIKIASAPYPPDTPQVILEHQAKLRAGAEFISGIVRKVARRYQNLIIQNTLFKGKLQDLTVVIHPCGDDTQDNHSDGECTTVSNGERLCAEVHLFVNIADSPKFIAFVIAHELSHMLLDMQLDRCRIGDSSKEGCQPGLSCVNRHLPPEPEMFGAGMEESIADSLAMYVVSCCRFSDKTGTYARWVYQWKSRQGFAPMLATAFGIPLEECKYIDEFTESPLPEGNWEDPETDGTNEEERQGFVSASIRNLFWYCVVINQFHFIVDDYNDTMGEGAWRELCRHMDAVQNDISQKGIVSTAGLEHQREAEQLIIKFVQKYTANSADNN